MPDTELAAFTEIRFDAGALAGCSVRFGNDSKFEKAFREAAAKK